MSRPRFLHRSSGARGRRSVVASMAFALVASFFVPGSASAFQRTMTCGTYGSPDCTAGEEPKPVAWQIRDLTYRIKEAPSLQFPEGMPSGGESDKFPPALASVLKTSFETWEDPSDCSELSFSFKGYTTEDIQVRTGGVSNNTNVVVWRESNWNEQPSILALTLASFRPDGELVDSDIKINAEDFQFGDLQQPMKNGGTADVRNTVVHEVGHFIGLAHSEDTEATMYGTATVGEIKKRTLHPDDIAGLCTVYPPKEPEDNDNGCPGCSSRSGAPGVATSTLLLAVIVVIAAGIRRSRRWKIGV